MDAYASYKKINYKPINRSTLVHSFLKTISKSPSLFFIMIAVASSFVLLYKAASITPLKSLVALNSRVSGIGIRVFSSRASETHKMTEKEFSIFGKPRLVDKKVLSKEQAEGQGAVVRRSIGRPELRNLDPFLVLDEFFVSPPAGFPDHPHRGFETVTYMLKGAFVHQDFAGHKGTIKEGDLQWMTAGRGIVHSEMPAAEGTQHGLQLWVNLASKDKM
eukprot:TRINITY_DN1659_c0_g2_i3.p1 TRINITY_DN1659_c0_g2~~TRINITY_DN1659_c0_g2_i3.p1  ORF type:complete len:218 (+),score=37.58 TRINITY_DN1659_c0_g2_i3:357-1010(+)